MAEQTGSKERGNEEKDKHFLGAPPVTNYHASPSNPVFSYELITII